MPTKPDVTTPGSPLTYSDFSFSGRTVKGYTNFIDLCEKEGGSHNYYFNTESDECAKANRGINVNDGFAWEGDVPANNGNKIFEQFGETEEINCGYYDVPQFVMDRNPPENLINYKYDYQFTKGNRTYHKTFYWIVTPQGGEYILNGIVYTVE